MADRERYLRYWGKARDGATGQAPCHLLAYHALDVAAVGEILLGYDRQRNTRLASALGLELGAFQRLFVFSLMLHDLGKFARSFQGQATPAGCDLVPPDPGMVYDGRQRRHDRLGAELWREVLYPNRLVLSAADPMVAMDLEQGVDLWLGCFFGHHGQPAAAPWAPLSVDFREEDYSAAEDFVTALEAQWGAPWPCETLKDEDWQECRLAPMTWELAGLATLSDWLGSNDAFFPYCAEPMPLADYWERRALPGARQVLKQTGLLEAPVAVAFPGFREAFSLCPTPLQAWAESAGLADGPQLLILEDITGSGKTEAALTLAHRLLAAGQGRGLYFGLPTMATSNAMYHRLGPFYRTLFPVETRPSLVLAHGARHLEDAFMESVVPEPKADRNYTREDRTASAECRAWLADSRKTALLAEVGVGTIDQALLGVLPRRHQSLRLLGLADKILVVDEVHAYDPYTTGLLKTLLAGHARQGGSAVLLSATLPHSLRRALVLSWQKGRDIHGEEPAADHFPLATQVHDEGVNEYKISAGMSRSRSLPVHFLHGEAEVQKAVIETARQGGCACWIRNTVDEAISAFEAIRGQLAEPERAILFHARFTMADRQRLEARVLQAFGKDSTATERAGRVLIATQVVEQSLDLDFDCLVSDLAPVDLLIQRAGRLHRHCRNADGNRLCEAGARDGRSRPALRILAPEWADDPAPDWIRSLLPGTAAVYGNPVQLWRTMGVLREEGKIDLPGRARVLMEAVYGDGLEAPAGLQQAEAEHWAGERVAAASARFNALDLELGYGRSAEGAGWDDDQEIGTRLSAERTVPVVLVRRGGEGKLEPWHADCRHPWPMSTVSLREGLAGRLPPLPSDLEGQAQALYEAHPGLRRSRFWLVEHGMPVRYDSTLGAVIPRHSEERSS
ncbi:CRISPR-associated helicase Cas3' [Ectothiorhodospira mobilis]|uniref:CRISPR-associated helicase Cas3' n=1 Tax=Ectothiorhodospira mobilis TaxID=195064 RepID=UPI0019085829|nr:CRISPR-associated helicase/endonuclease Cas3 [Ectothiorhodospira mobilis]